MKFQPVALLLKYGGKIPGPIGHGIATSAKLEAARDREAERCKQSRERRKARIRAAGKTAALVLAVGLVAGGCSTSTREMQRQGYRVGPWDRTMFLYEDTQAWLDQGFDAVREWEPFGGDAD